MSVVPVNRLEEDEVQQQPQRKAADENHRNGTLHFFVTVELQRDKRRDLRPDHAHDERQAAQFERMTEVQTPTEASYDFYNDAFKQGTNKMLPTLVRRPVIDVSSHDLVDPEKRDLSNHKENYQTAIVACC